MNEFCNLHKHGDSVYACEECELFTVDRCELAWAQMPYKEGEVKERPMADTKKNALAELAKRLDIIVFGLVTDGHPCDETIDIRKAQLIVEELAKVEDRREGETNSEALWRCNDCIAKCRVIAEEGAKDGK